jgi:hypothetical protein
MAYELNFLQIIGRHLNLVLHQSIPPGNSLNKVLNAAKVTCLPNASAKILR